jgi:hypothetical protein
MPLVAGQILFLRIEQAPGVCSFVEARLALPPDEMRRGPRRRRRLKSLLPYDVASLLKKTPMPRTISGGTHPLNHYECRLGLRYHYGVSPPSTGAVSDTRPIYLPRRIGRSEGHLHNFKAEGPIWIGQLLRGDDHERTRLFTYRGRCRGKSQLR